MPLTSRDAWRLFQHKHNDSLDPWWLLIIALLLIAAAVWAQVLR